MKMKSFFKTFLTILGGTLVLVFISFFIIHSVFSSYNNSNTDSSTQSQKSFWNDINREKALRAGANSFDNDGYKYFTLDLNDQYEVGYSDKNFEVSVFLKNNYNSRIDFSLNLDDFKINDSDLYGLNDKNSGLSKEQQQDLKIRAIQRFKDFQKEYYKVNG